MKKTILALSGMLYHSGKFTADEWNEKTGADPRHFQVIRDKLNRGKAIARTREKDFPITLENNC